MDLVGEDSAAVLPQRNCSPQPLTHYNRIHVFVASLLEPGSPFSSVYLCRDADFSVIRTSAGPAGVYAKFANFIIWAEVVAADPQLWINTMISETGDVLLAGRQELQDPHIGSFLIGRSHMRKAAKTKLFGQMSPQQRTKLDQWKQENAERIANSKLMDAMLADVAVPIIVPPRGKLGRNDLCFCGSGKKYKKYHGS